MIYFDRFGFLTVLLTKYGENSSNKLMGLAEFFQAVALYHLVYNLKGLSHPHREHIYPEYLTPVEHCGSSFAIISDSQSGQRFAINS